MKTSTFIVAALMVACVFAAAVYADASDAESAPTSAPEIKFWAYEMNEDEEYEWVSYSGHGYYAGQAIANSGLTFTWGSETYYSITLSGADLTYQYDSYGTTYTNINPYYGKVATVNGDSNFTVYRYSNGNWNPISSDSGMSVMGFYRPFDDCQLSSANIAFVPNGISPNTLPTTGLAHIYDVVPDEGTPDSAYAVTFHIGNNTYTGYGSDCAAAFKDAMIRNNVPYTVNLNMVDNGAINNSYFGEVTQIGNQAKSTTYTSVIYNADENKTHVTAYYEYWSLYLGNSTSYANSSAFMLGFMSPLSYLPTVPPVIDEGTPVPVQQLTQNEFTLNWENFTYSWVDNGDTRGLYPVN